VKDGKTFLLLLVVGLLGGCSAAADRPSVVLVTIDTLRADALGVTGSTTARTPRIDALAAEGVLFSRAKCVAPITLPSHATILTGLTPPEHGFRDNDPARPLPPPELRSFRTLAERLSEDGYATAAFVSASVLHARTGLDRGFDVYDGPGASEPGAIRYTERPGGTTVERAIAWLGEAERPLFLWVHLFDPHDPYRPPVPFRSEADPRSPEAYADEVAYADHGEGLGEHGEATHAFRLYETTLSVPLVARWPGRLEAGRVRDDLVSQTELAPAILAAAGLDAERGSILEGPTEHEAVAEALYGWRHMGWAQLTAAWEGDAKLVRGVRDVWYDLSGDPGETRPLEKGPEALAEALDRYRATPSRVGGGGESLEPLESSPYLSGLGRGRTAFLPPEENRKLRAPDASLAEAIGRAASLVGRADPRTAAAELLALRERDPGNPTISFWLGRARADGKDHAGAARAFRKAFGNGLREGKVLALWLRELMLAGRLEEAGEVIRAHEGEVVPHAGTRLMIASWHQMNGNIEKAKRYADLASDVATTPREIEQVSRFSHNLMQAKEQ